MIDCVVGSNRITEVEFGGGLSEVFGYWMFRTLPAWITGLVKAGSVKEPCTVA